MSKTAPSGLDALVAAIWGEQAAAAPAKLDPAAREAQNQALAAAIKAYLQFYLDDMPAAAPHE